MTRFIHTADWQLGMTRHFLAGEAQGRYAEARLEAIRRTAELAADESCDFVVVAGDVFEANQVDRQVVLRTLDALGSFAMPIYLLPGNHDPLLSAGSVWDSPVFTARCPKNVHVLRDALPLAVPGCDAEVVGAVWPSKRPTCDLVAACARALRRAPVERVLVGHGAIDVLGPDRDDPSRIGLEALEEAIAERRVSYAALGDRHSATEVGATGRAWYSGTPLVTDYDERQPNHVLLVELDGSSVQVEPVRVGDWGFVERRVEISRPEDVDSLATWLARLPDKARTVVRLAFVGTLTLGEKARLDTVLDEQRQLLAALEPWPHASDLAVLPDDGDLGDLGLGGFVAAAVEELRQTAATAEGGVAGDALALLYRLARREG